MPDIKDQFDRVVTQEQLTANQLKSLLEADVKVVEDIKLKLKDNPQANKSVEATDKRIAKIAKLLETYAQKVADKTNDDMKKAVELLGQLNKRKPVEKSEFVDFSKSLLSSMQKIKIENKITVSPIVKIPEVRPIVNNNVVVPGMNKMLGVISVGFEKLTQSINNMVNSQAKEVALANKQMSSANNIDEALNGMADKIVKAIGSILPTAEARAAREILIKAEIVRLEASNIQISAQNINLKERVQSNVGNTAPPKQIVRNYIVKEKNSSLPHLSKGGKIERSGLAMVHQGEAVISAGDSLKLGKLADAGLKKGSIYVHDEIAHQFLKEIARNKVVTNGPTPRNIEDALKPLFDTISNVANTAKKAKQK